MWMSWSKSIYRNWQYFYQGGKIDWVNLWWLADNNQCEAVIKRDAYAEINKMLEDLERTDSLKRSIENINIIMNLVVEEARWLDRSSGTGGKKCDVLFKQSYQATTVCEHAVQLWNYEEDKNACLPVLLLLEDCNADFQDDLRRELSNAVTTMKISPSKLCFIILCCKRALDPERMCKALPLRTVGSYTQAVASRKEALLKESRESQAEVWTRVILTLCSWVKSLNSLTSQALLKTYWRKLIIHLFRHSWSNLWHYWTATLRIHTSLCPTARHS